MAEWENIAIGDTIKIQVLQEMKIKSYLLHIPSKTDNDTYATLPQNFELTGQVITIGNILTLKTEDDQNDLEIKFKFPEEKKNNLSITVVEKGEPADLIQKTLSATHQPSSPEATPSQSVLSDDEKKFFEEYQPWKKAPDDICRLIQKNNKTYYKLHDMGALPKKIDIQGMKFNQNSKYKCNNGTANPANIVRRVFGFRSKGGNKKSRKIYKKKKSITSIKTHKLKKTFRKHFYRFKLSNNKTAKTYHGKFYRKKDITNSKKNKKT